MGVRAARRSNARRLAVVGAAVLGTFLAAPESHAAESADEPDSLRVLTFNAYIAPGISPDIGERLERLGPAVAALEPDLVGLQEVWKESHAQQVAAALAEAGLVYQHWVARPGTPPLGSSGLLTASRYPIENVEFFPFTAGDAPPYAFHADWMAQKGLLLARVSTPLGAVDFANTHLHAGYLLHDYEGVRLAQMSEVATFLGSAQRASAEAPPLVLAGDLNSRPESLPFRFLTEAASLAPVSPGPGVDHILVHAGARVALRPVEVQTVLTEPVVLSDGRSVPLSDHAGLLVVLASSDDASAVASPGGEKPVLVTAEAVAFVSQEIRTSRVLRWPALLLAAVGGGLGVQLGRRALRHRRVLLGFASVVVAVGVFWLAYLSLVYWPRHADDLEATKKRLQPSSVEGS